MCKDEIFSSSFAAAMYLKVNNFHKDKKVYVIGGEGILEELQIAGFTGLGGPVSSFFQYVLDRVMFWSKIEYFEFLCLSKAVFVYMQEDGEKRAQWKSNSLFEHDKSVLCHKTSIPSPKIESCFIF